MNRQHFSRNLLGLIGLTFFIAGTGLLAVLANQVLRFLANMPLEVRLPVPGIHF